MFRLIAFALLGLFTCWPAKADIIPGRTFDRFISIWLGKQVRRLLVAAPLLVLTRSAELRRCRQGPQHHRAQEAGHTSHKLLRSQPPEPTELFRSHRRRLLRPRQRWPRSRTHPDFYRRRPARLARAVMESLHGGPAGAWLPGSGERRLYWEWSMGLRPTAQVSAPKSPDLLAHSRP
jgi:hypothetical protein